MKTLSAFQLQLKAIESTLRVQHKVHDQRQRGHGHHQTQRGAGAVRPLAIEVRIPAASNQV